MTVEKKPVRTIPVSPLRDLYRMLRKVPAKSFEKDMSELFAARQGARIIADLFTASVLHCAGYDNRGEGFRNGSSRRKEWDSGATENRFAQRLRQLMDHRKVAAIIRGESDVIECLDSEVNPLRTTRSKFEDGRSGKYSGTGGIDLLLRWNGSGIPIIGEVKAETEAVGSFFALLQALTYAAELVTPNQWERLLKFHPPPDGKRPPDRRIDIALIFEVAPPPAEHRTISQFIGHLLENPEVSARLGRIMIFTVRADPPDQDRVEFESPE